MFKVCHQLCYGFENLMSSWRVWISFSNLLWGNVFLKNHAKSKVFQNTPSTMPFLNIFFQFGQNFDIFRPQSFRSFDQALTSPSGVQRRIYTTSTKCEFDGVGGLGGGLDGTEYQMGSSIFFRLCGYTGHVYIYRCTCSKFFTNIDMGLQIWCQVGEFEFHFQNYYEEMCFWKIMLKVRSFKSTSDHRPFLSNFDVKLRSWGMIHTSENRPLEVSTKPLQLPPGSSAGFTPRAHSAS